MNPIAKWGLAAAVATGVLGGAWTLQRNLLEGDAVGKAVQGGQPVPVEVAAIVHEPIERRRDLSGTVEAGAEFRVSPKVSGRLKKIAVDIGDVVERGQVVAVLDDEEFRRIRAEAEASLGVARARKTAADKALTVTQRNYERVSNLHEDNILPEQELDTATAAKLEAEASVAIATAEVGRVKAALDSARVREGYTRVAADWPEGDAQRTVGARFADEGTTVAANAELLMIVDLDPVIVAIQVTERDYPDLVVGQAVRLRTDAFGDEVFEGTVERMAPMFGTQSRRARVELRVPNPLGRLKPGMFVRAQTVLERIENATIVPEDAVVIRDGKSVVFVVAPDRQSVILREVSTGIRSDGRVAITGEEFSGEVVVLGQQQLDDGSAISVAQVAEASG